MRSISRLILILMSCGFLYCQTTAHAQTVQNQGIAVPSVPDLRPESLRSNLQPKTFSVLTELNPRDDASVGARTINGTQAIQRSSANDFSRQVPGRIQPADQMPKLPADQMPKLPPAPMSFENSLRPVKNQSSAGKEQMQAGHPTDARTQDARPVGDAKLGYSAPPQPPKSSRFPTSFDEQNQYDPRSRQTYPPVNQEPVQTEADSRAEKISAANDLLNATRNGNFDVRPASYQQPIAPNSQTPRTPPSSTNLTASRNGANASDQKLIIQILDRYKVSNAPDPLPGKPMKLVEILGNKSARQKYRIVNKYWETYEEWALLINAAERLQQLNTIQVTNMTERGLLETAKSRAADMIVESEIRLKESQASLQRVAGLPVTDLLPLPADQPWVKKFATHYDYFVKRRSMPAILKSLDETMPQTLRLISTRAQTALLASNTLSQTSNAYTSRQSNMGSLLSAVDLWYRANVDLIRSIGKYNRSTAQYAFNFRPNQSNQKLVKMLIGSPRPLVANQLPPARTASLPESFRPQNSPRSLSSRSSSVQPDNSMNSAMNSVNGSNRSFSLGDSTLSPAQRTPTKPLAPSAAEKMLPQTQSGFAPPSSFPKGGGFTPPPGNGFSPVNPNSQVKPNQRKTSDGPRFQVNPPSNGSARQGFGK